MAFALHQMLHSPVVQILTCTLIDDNVHASTLMTEACCNTAKLLWCFPLAACTPFAGLFFAAHAAETHRPAPRGRQPGYGRYSGAVWFWPSYGTVVVAQVCTVAQPLVEGSQVMVVVQVQCVCDSAVHGRQVSWLRCALMKGRQPGNGACCGPAAYGKQPGYGCGSSAICLWLCLTWVVGAAAQAHAHGRQPLRVSGLADKLSHQPVISSQLDFAPEGMVFEVEEETVRQAIVNDLVDAMVQCVRSFPRIMASEVVQKLPPLPPHLVVDVSRHMGNHSPTQHHHAHHHARGQHQSELRSMLPKGTDLPAILMGYKPLMRNRCGIMRSLSGSEHDQDTIQDQMSCGAIFGARPIEPLHPSSLSITSNVIEISTAT
eukprot:1160450-Pelagomonas_calceolata.AAC.17